MQIESLKSLQARVRECKGADRELDHAICMALNYVPYIPDNAINQSIPHFTTYPEGLGACVALMMEVLPGYTRVVDASAPECLIDVDISPPGPGLNWIKGRHELETHATLLVILSAVIAREEDRALLGEKQ